MKKLLFLSLVLGSIGASANYSCSGSSINIEINTSSNTIKVSGDYNGTVNNMKDGGGDYYGSASSGDNFKSISVNVDDGDVDLVKSDGRSKSLSVDCD